ncbi:tail fiber protein [Haemophilus haemolyticus]|uniref:tail fiber protein n=1 Tax=Haemophilus haemolyticus TaxID=726 RepID=UPI001EFE62A5|nr:tail fiber protein [Haemophilus haemolyticus]
MALVNKPDESIFASSAKQGEVDNFPDLLRGWGVTFDQTQGIPPMEWFNFLFKRLDEKHTYLMQRGLPEWSATQDYTKGSCVQFEGLSYRALKNSKNNSPNESDSQYWVRWGFALSEIAQATLTQYGITKLYTGYDSQSEDLALTPKTAYQLKQLIDSNTRSLGNVIPNSKKSSAVDSNSSDTVATSAAVKTAYDLANSKQSPATTLAGYGIGNFKIEPFVGNVNTLQTDGIYAVTQASRSQNLPVAGNGCHIQVIAGGDGRWCRQIAYIAYSTDMYERHQTNYQTDSWSAWGKLNDIEPVRQLVAQKADLADFSYQKIGDIEVRKYPDGTMIQTCRKRMLTNDYSKVNFNWAIAFADMPILTATAQYLDSVGDHDTIITFVQGTSNSACHLVCGETYNNSGEIAYVNVVAIGRWKR